jgi:uncharacterized membrane protein YfcA
MRFYLLVLVVVVVAPTFLDNSAIIVAASAASSAAGRCESFAATVYDCPVVACADNDHDHHHDGSSSVKTTTTTTTTVTDCLTSCPGFPSSTSSYHNDDGDDSEYRCIDRQLFSSAFFWRDVWTILLWFVTAGIAMAAGVGGGGIFVPAGILLSAFAPKQSAGLSQASVFGATLGGLLLNLTSHHPMSGRITAAGGGGSSGGETTTTTYYTRPLIDYDMALFLTPMLMAGAVLGVLIQALLPNWLYLLLAVIVLSYTAHTTFTKYQSTRVSEDKVALQSQSQAQTKNGTTNGTTTTTSRLVTTNDRPAAYGATIIATKEEEDLDGEDNDITLLPQRQAFLQNDARQFPTEKLFALMVLWVGLLILTVLLGGQGVDSPLGITCHSPWYLLLMMAQFIWMLAFAVVYGYKLLVDQRARRMVGYPYYADDVVWDIPALRFFGVATFLGGIVAGLIGIGGGMVLGPLMLVMNIHPRVASATTATMMVLTSSSVAIIFVTSGLVPWTYAAVLSGTCLVGSLLGKSKIDGYVKQTGRPSLLIFILAMIIAIATAGCAVILLLQLHESHWCLDGLNAFCPAAAAATTTTTTTVASHTDCAFRRMLTGVTVDDTQIPDCLTTN